MSSKVEDRDASAPPNDISDEDQEWFDILLAIEEGRPPDHAVLAKHLRSSKYVVEQPVLDYLADHLGGKIKRKRGRPKDETVERVLRDFRIKVLYASILPEMRKLPRAKRRCTPTQAALRETVKRLAAENKKHMSIGAVKRIVQSARTGGK